MICLCLILLSFFSSVNNEPPMLFSTKTNYDNIKGNAKLDLSKQKCEPVAIWYLSRHAYRYPKKKEMEKIREALDALKLNLVNSPKLTGDDKQQFKQWQMKFDPNKHDHILADIGKRQARQIGQYFYTGLRSITHLPYKIVSTNLQRTKETAKQFIQGFLDRPQMSDISIIAIPLNNSLLQYTENCPKYKIDVEDNDKACSNAKKFLKDNIEFEQELQHVRNRFGLTKDQLDAKMLEQITKACAYETSIDEQTSPWCKLLTGKLNEFKEYEGDLKHNCRYGYKYPINYEQTCSLMKQFHSDLSTMLKKPQNNFYFGHANTVTTFVTKLGLYKDPYSLEAKHFRQKNQWKISLISPMNTNIAFILYKNCRGSDNRYSMQVIHNQHLVIPDGCQGKPLCNVHEFLKHYSSFVKTCNFKQICDTTDGSNENLQHLFQ
ncbi:unnamed protein product [Didymodactylos carnosus]|uniref:Multiple inositol polyphosphate phosphatase 1 n=1 Tax=Didymodactylos carnosus TaxID=1234261 RepID=A0A814SEV1_9BILA|nr:unnamed protein product [Didymodactylos carnosus]CAF3910725.1 unnamed protein product [Didymodactylos carnosus]